NKYYRMKVNNLLIALIATTSLITACTFQNSSTPSEQVDTQVVQASYDASPVLDSYGFDQQVYKTEQRVIRRNENLASIFSQLGFSSESVNEAMSKTSGVLDLRKVIAGRPLQLYYDDLNPDVPSHIVYEQNLSEYVV